MFLWLSKENARMSGGCSVGLTRREAERPSARLDQSNPPRLGTGGGVGEGQAAVGRWKVAVLRLPFASLPQRVLHSQQNCANFAQLFPFFHRIATRSCGHMLAHHLYLVVFIPYKRA